MPQARVEDEGEGDHRAAEERPGREPVPRREEVLHDRELLERIGAKESFVKTQGPFHGVEILPGERVVPGEEVGGHRHVVHRPVADGISPGGEGQAADRVGGFPLGEGAASPATPKEGSSVFPGSSGGGSRNVPSYAIRTRVGVSRGLPSIAIVRDPFPRATATSSPLTDADVTWAFRKRENFGWKPSPGGRVRVSTARRSPSSGKRTMERS